MLPLGDHNAVCSPQLTLHGEQATCGRPGCADDITAFERLELQIRRSDRLASLGTLSAGLRTKSTPLVSSDVRALLPSVYHTRIFRDTFSNDRTSSIDLIRS